MAALPIAWDDAVGVPVEVKALASLPTLTRHHQPRPADRAAGGSTGTAPAS